MIDSENIVEMEVQSSQKTTLIVVNWEIYDILVVGHQNRELILQSFVSFQESRSIPFKVFQSAFQCWWLNCPW